MRKLRDKADDPATESCTPLLFGVTPSRTSLQYPGVLVSFLLLPKTSVGENMVLFQPIVQRNHSGERLVQTVT